MSKKQHLSRLAAPSTWPIKRKGIKWIAKPIPGTHTLEYSLSISVILRDLLKLAKTKTEAKKILNNRSVKINNKIITELKFPVGLFDTISIALLKKSYRMILNKKRKLILIEIPENEANLLPLKIKNKKTLKKGRLQANFNNGWNFIFDELALKNGDVILLDLEKKVITKKLKQEPGNLVYIIAGKRVGKIAKLMSIKEEGILSKRKIAILTVDKESWEVPLSQIYIIGKDKPEIKLE